MRKIVEILSPPDRRGFCDVSHGGITFKCYKDHMIPFNDLAKKILQNG